MASKNAVSLRMDNAASGPTYEAAVSGLKRCEWLRSKGSNPDWAAFRAQYTLGFAVLEVVVAAFLPAGEVKLCMSYSRLSERHGLLLLGSESDECVSVSRNPTSPLGSTLPFLRYGASGCKDFASLSTKDPRMDNLEYGAAPTLASKYGL